MHNAKLFEFVQEIHKNDFNLITVSLLAKHLRCNVAQRPTPHFHSLAVVINLQTLSVSHINILNTEMETWVASPKSPILTSMSSLRNIFSGFKSLKNSHCSASAFFIELAFVDGKTQLKKWSWASPKARCKYSVCKLLNLDINLLIGILPFSTLKTLWGGTTEKVHPMFTSFV